MQTFGCASCLRSQILVTKPSLKRSRAACLTGRRRCDVCGGAGEVEPQRVLNRNPKEKAPGGQTKPPVFLSNSGKLGVRWIDQLTMFLQYSSGSRALRPLRRNPAVCGFCIRCIEHDAIRCKFHPVDQPSPRYAIRIFLLRFKFQS
jgi:hypothetical protein